MAVHLNDDGTLKGEAMKVAALYLQPGDIVGSGETVFATSTGIRTPRGKIEVYLRKGDKDRMSYWGRSTQINITRPFKKPIDTV